MRSSISTAGTAYIATAHHMDESSSKIKKLGDLMPSRTYITSIGKNFRISQNALLPALPQPIALPKAWTCLILQSPRRYKSQT